MDLLAGLNEQLLRKYDVPTPRYTSYPTAPEWSDAVGPAEYATALAARAARPEQSLSLYVHIPFCRERCAFCGCNVVVARSSATADGYLDLVVRELDAVAAKLRDRTELLQVHWGGGTPTFLDQRQISALWSAISRRFHVLPSAEIAIEIDPAATSFGQLDLLRRLGFNRVSLGVQDLDPNVQRAIARIQTVSETRAMLDHARALGFRGINLDLIYGLPFQTEVSWARTLEQVIAMRPDRLAVYGFAYVPDVRPNQRRLPSAHVPHGLAKIHLHLQAIEALTKAGYRSIGMDHFALPHDELALAQDRRSLTRNFQGYAARAATSTVAVGMSAIGDLDGLYVQNANGLAPYASAIESGKLATVRGFRCSRDDRRRRSIITQLMCNFWVDLGPAGRTDFAPELKTLAEMEVEGLVRIRGAEIEVTHSGRIFVRNIASVFDAYLTARERPFSRAL